MSDRESPFTPNPALGGLLGLGLLAVAARSLADGLALGLGAALCALILGAAIPPLRRQLPERFRAPASLLLSAVLALLYGLAVEAYFPITSIGLGIYLPLLAVNGLSLQTIRLSARQAAARQAARADDCQTIDAPVKYGTIARGAGSYFLVAGLLGAIRELLGLGTLTLPGLGSDHVFLVIANEAPLRILATPAGGFILLGFMAALYRAALRARGRRII